MTPLDKLRVIVVSKTDNPDSQWRVWVAAVTRQQSERVAAEVKRERGPYLVR